MLDAPEIDKEDLGTCDAVVYYDLEDLEGAMVQMAMDAALWDTSLIGSSGAEVAGGDEQGTDALIERAPDVQRSPQA